VRFISQSVSDGISQQLFTLGAIPGVLWRPAAAPGPRPLVLLGHGGGQHKLAPGVTARARRFAAAGFAAAAIDAPGHGERPANAEHDQLVATIREQVAAGAALAGLMPGYNAVMSGWAVPDWQSVLDALTGLDEIGAGQPVGYWGVSMGGATGVALAAAEPRITAAVLGLIRGDGLEEAAAKITIPVEFHLQWDDEMVPRESGLALFGAFGSAEKTLHANPGGHGDVPRFEADSATRFFARHLGGHQPGGHQPGGHG
jgi:dienelactone hydrolase